jgi:hypothetical protein
MLTNRTNIFIHRMLLARIVGDIFTWSSIARQQFLLISKDRLQ